jgi:hypothetical protein
MVSYRLQQFYRNIPPRPEIYVILETNDNCLQRVVGQIYVSLKFYEITIAYFCEQTRIVQFNLRHISNLLSNF